MVEEGCAGNMHHKKLEGGRLLSRPIPVLRLLQWFWLTNLRSDGGDPEEIEDTERKPRDRQPYELF